MAATVLFVSYYCLQLGIIALMTAEKRLMMGRFLTYFFFFSFVALILGSLMFPLGTPPYAVVASGGPGLVSGVGAALGSGRGIYLGVLASWSLWAGALLAVSWLI